MFQRLKKYYLSAQTLKLIFSAILQRKQILVGSGGEVISPRLLDYHSRNRGKLNHAIKKLQNFTENHLKTV
jgi:hypothetical protein